MQQIQAGDYIIGHDRDLTRNAYASMKSGDAERCGCSYCRNFAAQRGTVYPGTFRLILDQLGIDPAKEGEVYESGPDGRLRVYGGWFYFAGELCAKGTRATDAHSGFQHGFADAKTLPKPTVDFGDKVLAIEFIARLPWVMPEQP